MFRKKLSFFREKGMHGFITTGNEKLANKRMQRMVNVSIIPEQFMHFYDSQKAFSNLCVILSVYKKNNNISTFILENLIICLIPCSYRKMYLTQLTGNLDKAAECCFDRFLIQYSDLEQHCEYVNGPHRYFLGSTFRDNIWYCHEMWIPENLVFSIYM